MASGQQHDRATWWLAVPLALLCWPWLGVAGVATAAGAFLFGGLWLSPDLDTLSRPSQRWGPLRWLWWPYRRWISHRAVWSHAPLIGTAGRLLYLGAWLALLSSLLQPWGSPGPQEIGSGLLKLWEQQRSLCLVALAGVEASCWLHLIQDGDPMPRWRRRRRRR